MIMTASYLSTTGYLGALQVYGGNDRAFRRGGINGECRYTRFRAHVTRIVSLRQRQIVNTVAKRCQV